VAPSTAATLPVSVHFDLNSISLVTLNSISLDTLNEVKGAISDMALSGSLP